MTGYFKCCHQFRTSLVYSSSRRALPRGPSAMTPVARLPTQQIGTSPDVSVPVSYPHSVLTGE